jgi:hypothetical protein
MNAGRKFEVAVSLKHDEMTSFGCGEQFEVAVSLNHDIITSFWLHKRPRIPQSKPISVGITV